jgi:hypothetical protein
MVRTLVSHTLEEECQWASHQRYTIPLQDWGDYTEWQRDMQEGEHF